MPTNDDRAQLGCGFLVLLAVAAFLSVKLVDAGETCLAVRLGRPGRVFHTGLNLKWPVIERAACYPAREVVYETLDSGAVSNQAYSGPPVDTTTSDGQKIIATYNVWWRVDPEKAAWVYTHVAQTEGGVQQKVVEALSRSDVRNALKAFEAEQLYTKSVDQAQTAIETRLRESYAAQGVTLVRFTLRHLEFDPDYSQSIEDKQKAYVDADKAVSEQRRLSTLAYAAATQTASAVQADVNRVREQGNAEATAAAVVGRALQQYPAVVSLEFVKRQKVQWGIVPQGQSFLLQLPAAVQEGPQ